MDEHTQEPAEIGAHVDLDESARFAQIPQALLYDRSISHAAVRLYGLLLRHGSDPANCYPSYRRMAELIGGSARSMPGYVRELEAAGWVQRHQRWTPDGDSDSNGYRVYGRAQERGGCAPQSAPKESNRNESNRNESEIEQLDLTGETAAQKAARRFDRFWNAYPRRDGKRVGKAKAHALWMKMKPVEHEAAWVGVQNYARSGWRPRDAHRWLRDREWEDWQEPAKPESERGRVDPYAMFNTPEA